VLVGRVAGELDRQAWQKTPQLGIPKVTCVCTYIYYSMPVRLWVGIPAPADRGTYSARGSPLQVVPGYQALAHVISFFVLKVAEIGPKGCPNSTHVQFIT